MKLYYAPWACSISDHIALAEAGADFELERVDLKTKMTQSGRDFLQIAPKGYVPALELDTGEVLSENIAILDWIGSQHPQLTLGGALGRTRVLEALAYIGAELHHDFTPMWRAGGDEQKATAALKLSAKLKYVSGAMRGDYLFGGTPSVADFYLFVMLLWAGRYQVPTTPVLEALRARMLERPAVRRALSEEGILDAVLASATA